LSLGLSRAFGSRQADYCLGLLYRARQAYGGERAGEGWQHARSMPKFPRVVS
jgi:hypothetical protein